MVTPDVVEQLVNEEYFDLVVMVDDPAQMGLRGDDIWPQALLAAIARNYRVVSRFNCRDAAAMLEPLSIGGSQQGSSETK